MGPAEGVFSASEAIRKAVSWKTVMKREPMIFSFAFGLGDAGEGGEEARAGVYDGEVDAQGLREGAVHVFGFVLAEQAVVDEDGVKAGADCRVH